MKLGTIVFARESLQRLAKMRLPAQMTYRVLKFLRAVDGEQSIAETQRVDLVRRLSGAGEGEVVTLGPGTPEFQEFMVEYAKVLDAESELQPSDIKLVDLLAALDSNPENRLPENALSSLELAALEPFFST